MSLFPTVVTVVTGPWSWGHILPIWCIACSWPCDERCCGLSGYLNCAEVCFMCLKSVFDFVGITCDHSYGLCDWPPGLWEVSQDGCSV